METERLLTQLNGQVRSRADLSSIIQKHMQVLANLVPTHLPLPQRGEWMIGSTALGQHQVVRTQYGQNIPILSRL